MFGVWCLCGTTIRDHLPSALFLAGPRIFDTWIGALAAKWTAGTLTWLTHFGLTIENGSGEAFLKAGLAVVTLNILQAGFVQIEGGHTGGRARLVAFHILWEIAGRFLGIEEKLLWTFVTIRSALAARNVRTTIRIVTMECVGLAGCTHLIGTGNGGQC